MIRDPLAPPQLKLPTLRGPANVSPPSAAPEIKEKPPDSSFFQYLINQALPKVHAQLPAPIKQKIVFSWYEVPGAEEYLIEISSSPDFQKPEVSTVVSTEKLEWSEYQEKIYYWRVAAGKKNGKRGLFSEPGRADLSQLSNEEAPLGPGVDLAPLVQVEKPRAPKVVKPVAPTPVVEPVHYPEPPAPFVESPPLPQAPRELPMDKTDIYRAWASAVWQHSEISGPDDIDVEQTGFATLDMGVDVNYRLSKDKGSLLFHGRWTTLSWKADAASQRANQEELSDLRSLTTVHYRPTGSTFAYGVAVDIWPLPVRQTLESVKLERVWHLGPSAEWLWEGEKFRGRHQIAALIAGSNWELFHASSGDWILSETDFLRPYLGANLEFRLIDGSGYQGTVLRLGLHVGLEW